jgi:hypothetical protein
MTRKYCERCRTKIKRYVTGRCKPCQRATDKRSRQRRQECQSLTTTINSSRAAWRQHAAVQEHPSLQGVPARMARGQQGNRYVGNYYWKKKGQQPWDPP